jgi:hypothetical protein
LFRATLFDQPLGQLRAFAHRHHPPGDGAQHKRRSQYLKSVEPQFAAARIEGEFPDGSDFIEVAP